MPGPGVQVARLWPLQGNGAHVKGYTMKDIFNAALSAWHYSGNIDKAIQQACIDYGYEYSNTLAMTIFNKLDLYIKRNS